MRTRFITGTLYPNTRIGLSVGAYHTRNLTRVKSVVQRTNSRSLNRVCVVRREGVPSFLPRVPFPNIIKHGNNLKEFLLDKCTYPRLHLVIVTRINIAALFSVVNSTIAAYKAPTFQERLLKNRRSFLEQVIRSIDKTEAV
jgi:hypothetical protein